MKDLKYIAAYLMPLSSWFALQYLGNWSWATLVFAFGILPILDALWPMSTANVPPEEEAPRLQRRFFDWLLYVNVPIVFGLLFVYFQTLKLPTLALSEQIGLTLSLGTLLGTMGINIAHELGHRDNIVEQNISKLLLMPSLYMHFFIEHNRGHHKHVSTDADPASARLGENIFGFWFRSLFGQYRSAWALEKERLGKEGRPVVGWQNQMLRFLGFQALWLLGIAWFFGASVVPYAIAVALVAVLLLETVNYIEHYGLRRKMLPSGRPEPVTPQHSWNSNHELGRIFLFELTRHSDHHYKSTRKYQILRSLDESPQLATGYPGSMLMALMPPLWFWVMNKRVQKST